MGQVNFDDHRGLVNTTGTGWRRNGSPLALTAAQLNLFQCGGIHFSISGVGTTILWAPVDGTIIGGYVTVTRNPGAETVLNVFMTTPGDSAGTFTIANGTSPGETDALSLGAGTRTVTAGSAIFVRSDGGASVTTYASIQLLIQKS